MAQGRIDNWALLPGAQVEIRQKGAFVSIGIVDTVTEDGEILWIWNALDGRRLFEKRESYEAWPAEDRIGFHYQLAAAGPF